LSADAPNRQIVVREIPEGSLTSECFELQTVPRPIPGEGELLIRTILMSIDAANRAWMQGATYRDAVKAGEVMHTYCVAEVVESGADSFRPGDVVVAEAGWAEFSIVAATAASRASAARPISRLLSVFGVAGLTAHHGLIQVGRAQTGETVAVSAAAGSVGIYVGQIAKAMGCRVVGIAGGEAKCRWVVETLGFDDCVDYRAGGLFKRLRAACPEGIDVYFDNVGGKILESALFLMNMKGRVVCCGAVSQYDESVPSGPRNLPGLVVVKRLRMEGFIVFDFREFDGAAVTQLAAWVASGQIQVIEDIIDGLENAPRALIGLLAGDNRGKRMVRVAADPT